VLSQLDTNKKIANTKALEIADRIQQGLKKEIMFKKMSFSVGTSIGLSLLAPVKKSGESVIKDADAAMYRAKKSGKGCVVVSNV